MKQTKTPAKTGVPAADRTAFRVYYDGACPLCSREIAQYRRCRGAEGLEWVDVSLSGEAALGSDLSRDRALAEMHVRLENGGLVGGAAAFVAIWTRLPAFAWMARIFGGKAGLRLLTAAYGVFLRVRRSRRRSRQENECRSDIA